MGTTSDDEPLITPSRFKRTTKPTTAPSTNPASPAAQPPNAAPDGPPEPLPAHAGDQQNAAPPRQATSVDPPPSKSSPAKAEPAATPAGAVRPAGSAGGMGPAQRTNGPIEGTSGTASHQEQPGNLGDSARQPAGDVPPSLAAGEAGEGARSSGSGGTTSTDVLSIVWAQVKGYPHWPAQVLPEDAAEKWLVGARKGKGVHLPVMFFGTYEVGWMPPAFVCTWQAGLDRNLDARKLKPLASSIQQAKEYMAGGWDPRWWQHSDGPQSEVKEEPAAAKEPKAQAAKLARMSDRQAAAKKAHPRQATKRRSDGMCGIAQQSKRSPKRKRASLGDALSFHTVPDLFDSDDEVIGRPKSAPKPSRLAPASAPKATSPVAKAESTEAVAGPGQPGGVDEGRAGEQAGKGGRGGRPGRQSFASGSLPGGQAPLVGVEGVAPPKYGYVRSNVWPSYMSRPKRLPKDDVPTCDCLPSARGSSSGGDRESRSRGEEQGDLFAAPSDERFFGFPGERSKRARVSLTRQPGRTDCGPECMNRQSFTHCDARSCPCGDRCTNKPFHLLAIPRLQAFHTGDRGWGVRADQFIPAGTFVVEYTGELMNKAEKQRRVEEQARSGILDFYMMEHSPGVVIDARLRGNLARLINSSCDPNCITQKWRDAGTDESRIGIFAQRDIAPGEEISYDYNFEHSGLAEQAGAYRCKCGAATCRGTMDTQPERLKDAFKRIDVFWDGDQRFYRGTILSYNATSGQHAIQYDDGQRTKEHLSAVRHRWVPEECEAACPEGLEADSLPHLTVIYPTPGSVSQQTQPACKKRRNSAGASQGRKKGSQGAATKREATACRPKSAVGLPAEGQDPHTKKEAVLQCDIKAHCSANELHELTLGGEAEPPAAAPATVSPAAEIEERLKVLNYQPAWLSKGFNLARMTGLGTKRAVAAPRPPANAEVQAPGRKAEDPPLERAPQTDSASLDPVARPIQGAEEGSEVGTGVAAGSAADAGQEAMEPPATGEAAGNTAARNHGHTEGLQGGVAAEDLGRQRAEHTSGPSTTVGEEGVGDAGKGVGVGGSAAVAAASTNPMAEDEALREDGDAGGKVAGGSDLAIRSSCRGDQGALEGENLVISMMEEIMQRVLSSDAAPQTAFH